MIEDLILKLKKEIINELQMEYMTPEDMDAEAPLFGEGLGLDSIDALELTVALEKRFKLSIPDEEVGKKAFSSVEALAAFVEEHRQDQ